MRAAARQRGGAVGFWDFFGCWMTHGALLAEDAEEGHQPAQLKMLLNTNGMEGDYQGVLDHFN